MTRARSVEPRQARALWLLAGIGLALRIAFIFLEPATHPVADERTWTNWALDSLVPRHFNPFHTSMIFYPPLYVYFIGVLFVLFHSLTAVKCAQAVVGALLVPCVGYVGTRTFSERAGLLSAAFVCAYPELIWFAAHFWSETLFMTFLWLAIAGLMAADGKGASFAALSGLLWGLAILTRETVLYFTPIACLYLWIGRTPGARARAASFFAAVFLTVCPWTFRNYEVLHAFIPVSTAGGLNLWQGNALLGREEVYARYEQIHGRAEQYHHAVQKGLEAIWERQPLWFFEKLHEEMPNFWEADSQALVHVKRGAYGPMSAPAAWGVALLVIGPYLAALALFAWGLTLFRADRESLFLLAFLVYDNLLHVVTHGYARYRLPAIPVVLLFAALGATERGRPFAGRRWLLGLGAGLVLALSLVPSIRINLADPVFGLTSSASEASPEGSPVP